MTDPRGDYRREDWRSSGESGQSDRIPPVVCCEGCVCEVAHGDWQVDYGEITHLRLQSRRLLDRVHRLEASAAPPEGTASDSPIKQEPPLDVERLAEAIRNTYLAPSASRDLDADNIVAEYIRLGEAAPERRQP